MHLIYKQLRLYINLYRKTPYITHPSSPCISPPKQRDTIKMSIPPPSAASRGFPVTSASTESTKCNHLR